MATQVAKKRFIPNTPVNAGVLYKHTIAVGNSQKTYILKAKYNKTLSEMNPLWFENINPKEYFFNRATFDSSNVSIFPNDTIHLVDEAKSYTSNQLGFVEKAELSVLFEDQIEAKSGTFISPDSTNRIRKINIYPFLNPNYEVTQYYSPFDMTSIVAVRLQDVEDQDICIFEVKTLFTPTFTSSATTHKVRVYFINYSVTYEGISPTTTTSDYAEYTIPNALTIRKLTMTNVSDVITLKFEVYA